MSSKSSDLKVMQDYFFKALGMAGMARRQFLKQLADEDHECWKLLKSLLDAEETADQIFEPPLLQDTHNPLRSLYGMIGREVEKCISTFMPGDYLGPYEILEHLGSGGMGEVYKVRLEEPIRREVALKLIGEWKTNEAFVKRFQIECQVLALMNSDHIAKVYEFGEIGDVESEKRPYFTMEYIEGQELDLYCLNKKMSIRERVKLFLQVCEGVHHAHVRGIIHGDLKPTNMLVTHQSGKPVAKVIDFGGALVFSPDTARLMKFSDDMMFGSPYYMSPEQATPHGVIDFRSDVHGLGAVLFKLLCGLHIYDETQFAKASPGERLTLIRDGGSRDSIVRAVQARGGHGFEKSLGLTKKALVRRLKGDLEWIVAKAMALDPDNRYESVSALMADLKRYLNDEPIAAVRWDPIYVARKWLIRNRVPALIGSILLFGLFSLGRGSMIVRKTLTKMQRTHAFYETILSQPQPIYSGQDVRFLTVLQGWESQIGSFTEDDEEAECRVRLIFGETYFSLGDYQGSLLQYQKVLDVLANLGNADRASYIAALDGKARCLTELKRLADADVAYQVLLEAKREYFGDSDPGYLENLSHYAVLLMDLGHSKEALKQGEKTFERIQMIGGFENVRTQKVAVNFANILQRLDQFDRASSLYERVIAQQPDGHPRTLRTKHNLALVYKKMEQFPKAETLLLKVLQKRREILGDDHPHTVSTKISLLDTYIGEGEIDQAKRLGTVLIEQCRTVFGGSHETTLRVMNMMAAAYLKNAEYPKAIELLTELADFYKENQWMKTFDAAVVLHNLGLAYRETGFPDKSIDALRSAIQIKLELFPESHSSVLGSRVDLALSLKNHGEVKEAIRLLRSVLDVSSINWLNDEEKYIKYTTILAGCLSMDHQYEESERLLLSNINRVDDSFREHVLHELTLLYRRWGKPEELGRIKPGDEKSNQ